MEPVWTKAQVAAHQRALSVARKVKPAIDRLTELAKHNPAFAQRVKDLADMRDHLELSAATALEIDPTGKTPQEK